MTDDPRFLDPDQAPARFGELLHLPTRTHQQFERDEGIWRAEMERGPGGLVLKGYRLGPKPRAAKVPFRRPGK